MVREELEVAAPSDSIPPAVRSRLEQWVDPSAVHPVANLDTVRHRLDVTDGIAHVELIHDRVCVVDGSRVVARFAEVEVEFTADGRTLVQRLVHLLIGNGAVVDTTPKYVRALRALGREPPDVTL